MNPVDVPAFDQRNERGHSEPRRSERAGERHTDGDVGVEHLSREELTGFPQPRGVVGEERVVDQIGCRLGTVDRLRLDTFTTQKLGAFMRRVLGAGALAFFRRALLVTLGTGRARALSGHSVPPTPGSPRARLPADRR
jgi:hypothetical protein